MSIVRLREEAAPQRPLSSVPLGADFWAQDYLQEQLPHQAQVRSFILSLMMMLNLSLYIYHDAIHNGGV